MQINSDLSNRTDYTLRDKGWRETGGVFRQAFTLVIKCQNVKAFYLALLAGASFDTQYMYDNISVEQSGKGPGRILKTSPDLSTVAVIANARQGENVSLL